MKSYGLPRAECVKYGKVSSFQMIPFSTNDLLSGEECKGRLATFSILHCKGMKEPGPCILCLMQPLGQSLETSFMHLISLQVTATTSFITRRT
jgi:hypothetical protein